MWEPAGFGLADVSLVFDVDVAVDVEVDVDDLLSVLLSEPQPTSAKLNETAARPAVAGGAKDMARMSLGKSLMVVSCVTFLDRGGTGGPPTNLALGSSQQIVYLDHAGFSVAGTSAGRRAGWGATCVSSWSSGGAVLDQVFMVLALIAALMNAETVRRMVVCREG